MGNRIFQLPTVVRFLPDQMQLAEALGFPEISALGENDAEWQPILAAKAKAILEDPDLTPARALYRRILAVEPTVFDLEFSFEPTKRSPSWQQPVTFKLPVVRWQEGELHQAYVPAPGVLVFAPRPELLPDRVREHLRLVLMGRRRKLSLRDLEHLSRTEAMEIKYVEVSATMRPPTQLAVSRGQEPEAKSMLASLAEELPPKIARAQPPDPDNHSPRPHDTISAAFELELETARLAEALSGPQRRSVLLVGAPGCGKTAVVRELARRRREFGFGHTAIWTTTGARLMTGPIGFGMWQDRCQKLCREAAHTGAILHLGHLAELLEVGKASRGQQTVGGFLRPWLARGDLLAIAECTPERISAIERQDPHLLHAFVQLPLPERTPAQTRAILAHVFETAEGRPEPATREASELALDRLQQLHQRYALYSANPGRPLRFLNNLLADRFPEKSLTEAQVTTAFSRETGLPKVLLDDALPLDLDSTRDWFARQVIGQPEAITGIVDLLAIIKARLARPGKPLASLLFIGPTGTGKTELAKALAGFLFGDPARLARFDLNQFNDPVSLQRLVGGPLAGAAEGLLTARIREQPFSVLLLDEFEKADPAFFDLLLQILGDGRLTDATGRVADFANSVIVMTSNLGAQGFSRGAAGFRADGMITPDAREHFTAAVRQFLRPEIFNRLDAVIPFRPLPAEVVLAIANRQLQFLQQRDGLRLRSIELRVLPGVAEYLARKGFDLRYGARPLKRAIERELLAPLSDALAGSKPDLRGSVQVSVVGEKVRIEPSLRPVEEPYEPLETAAPAKARLAVLMTEERRHIARLRNCPAVVDLENQVTMSTSLQRKLAATPWKSPEQQLRLGRLPRLRECLEQITSLYDRARQLETEALALFYQRDQLESGLFTPELEGLQAGRRRLLREVFRLKHDQPDDIVLAAYSEHQSCLLTFGEAYFSLAAQAGQVVAFEFILAPPAGRSPASHPVRQAPKQPANPFASLPRRLIGLVMHLRGDLFFPRFENEAGLHLIVQKQGQQACLIQTIRPPFAEYQPPRGIERKGEIKALRAALRRTFDHDKNLVHDPRLGERPWHGGSIRPCLSELLDEHLRNAIEGVTHR